MPMPTAYDLMLPILKMLADGEVHHSSALAGHLAQHFNLTQSEVDERTPSGQRRLPKRIDWARWLLKKAVLLEYPKPGFSLITERGLQVLADSPLKIDDAFLNQFEEYQSGQKTVIIEADKKVPGDVEEDTPEESLKAAYDSIRTRLADEILEMVKNSSPSFFEWLVVDVLVGMGYGGSREEAGKAVGGSNDAELMGSSMRTG